MKILEKFLQKFYIKLHSYLYHKISRLGTKIEGGINPKHRLMKYYQYFVDNIDLYSKVLDIGCGIGFVSYKVSEKARSVLGVDINGAILKIARKKYYRNNITYIKADIMYHKFTEKFDYIILSNVLEHIRDRRKFLEIIKDLSSILLIRVPMINRSWLALYKKELGLDYRLDSSHYIEYTLETFTNEIESAGLKILSFSIQYGEIWAKVKT